MNTIHEILDMPIEKLEAMSDEELKAFVAHLIPKAREPAPDVAEDKVNDLLKKCSNLFK